MPLSSLLIHSIHSPAFLVEGFNFTPISYSIHEIIISHRPKKHPIPIKFPKKSITMSINAQDFNSDALHVMLKESVHRFLTEHRSGVTDFSNFTVIFSRFLQNVPDPPLELVWFYSALTSHSVESTASYDASLQLCRAKELFQLLVSCTPCTEIAAKKVAVLSPVIYELCRLSIEKKCSRKEVESLLEKVVGYISLCCGVGFDRNGECEVLSSCFPDLVHIWVIDKVGDDLGLFFPVVRARDRERLVNEGCTVGSLAGVVMIECFLLSLCLKFGCGISRAELRKELGSSAVQAIEAFRSYHFIDTLLWMLLDPVLPVVSLVNYEDEVLLREILYDAVTVVGSSLFSPGKDMQLPNERLKDLAVTWLFVADSAIRFVRENDDPMKAISYLQAFSGSCLASKLVQWVKNQSGMEIQRSIPNVSTPLALIKWLLIVEDQGVAVFGSTISKIYAKTIICKSRLECDLSHIGEHEVDGDLEMADDSMYAMFLPVPRLLKLTGTDGTRKRKDEGNGERDKPVKSVKCVDASSRREKGNPVSMEH